MKKHNRLLLFLGSICLAYWFIDFINITVLSHRPTWLLWYSSSGLLLTAVALLTESEVLIYSLFCALFILEFLWSLDFLSILFIGKSFLGVTKYAFASSFSKKDFYMTMYHLLIPSSLFLAVLKTSKIYRYGWVGASIFAGSLMLLSAIFVNPHDNVNCIYPVAQCKSLSNLYQHFSVSYRVLILLITTILFVYIPSNYFVLWLKKRSILRKVSKLIC